MKGATKLGLVIAGAVVFGLLLLVLNALWPVTLQTVSSPDGKHTVELQRADHIDRNYSVLVDGKRVYVSPDFAPRRDLPFREALIWDSTGKIVMLEIARQRIFGYDVANSRQLEDEKLLATTAAPEPPLSEYYFEAEWPGIGRVRRGDATQGAK